MFCSSNLNKLKLVVRLKFMNMPITAVTIVTGGTD